MTLPDGINFEDYCDETYEYEELNEIEEEEFNYKYDCELISHIQFRTNFNQNQKNKLISEIEERMAKEEQLELNGKGTGYYQ